MTDEELIEELSEMGGHPCRAHLPMGEKLRQASDRLKALTAEVERKEAALRDLVKEYVSNVDPYRTGRFYIDPEQEDVVVEARAALEKQP